RTRSRPASTSRSGQAMRFAVDCAGDPAHAGPAMPVAVAALGARGRVGALPHPVECGDHPGGIGSGTDAHDIGPPGGDIVEVAKQVGDATRHRLDSVEGEKALALLRFHRYARRILDATKAR